MNHIMTDYYPLFRLYQRLRGQVLDVLSDEELAFTPGGRNLPIGALCREIGETQQNYINSFKSLELHFDYQHPEPEVEQSIAALREWYQRMDQELEQVISAFTDEELQTKKVDRGGGFVIPIQLNLTIYQEALIIFYGKISVYLKMLDKTPSDQWAHWIA